MITINPNPDILLQITEDLINSVKIWTSLVCIFKSELNPLIR